VLACVAEPLGLAQGRAHASVSGEHANGPAQCGALEVGSRVRALHTPTLPEGELPWMAKYGDEGHIQFLGKGLLAYMGRAVRRCPAWALRDDAHHSGMTHTIRPEGLALVLAATCIRSAPSVPATGRALPHVCSMHEPALSLLLDPLPLQSPVLQSLCPSSKFACQAGWQAARRLEEGRDTHCPHPTHTHHGAGGVGRQELQGRGVRGGGRHDDGVLHGTSRGELLDQLGHGGALLANGHVHAVHALGFLHLLVHALHGAWGQSRGVGVPTAVCIGGACGVHGCTFSCDARTGKAASISKGSGNTHHSRRVCAPQQVRGCAIK